MNRLVASLAMFGSRPADFSRLPVRRQGVSLPRHGGDSADIFYPYCFLRPEYLCDEGMFSWSFQVGRLFEFCLFVVFILSLVRWSRIRLPSKNMETIPPLTPHRIKNAAVQTRRADRGDSDKSSEKRS